MRRANALACALLLAAAAAASQESPQVTIIKRTYDEAALLHPPALSASAYRGRTVWLQRCAYCHDGVGQPSYQTMGPWIGAETVQTLGEPALRAIVAAGTERMPGFQYALTPAQLDDLLAFLKTIPADQKPTAAQLAGKSSEGPGGND